MSLDPPHLMQLTHLRRVLFEYFRQTYPLSVQSTWNKLEGHCLGDAPQTAEFTGQVQSVFRTGQLLQCYHYSIPLHIDCSTFYKRLYQCYDSLNHQLFTRLARCVFRILQRIFPSLATCFHNCLSNNRFCSSMQLAEIWTSTFLVVIGNLTISGWNCTLT